MKQGRFTLSKAERISNSRDFSRIFRRGKRIKFPGFTLVVLPNNLPFSRMGIAVGKRFGKAVKRNRAKRICRELFRLNKYRIPGGFDIVFLPHQEILEASWYKLQENMCKAGKIIERSFTFKTDVPESAGMAVGGDCKGI